MRDLAQSARLWIQLERQASTVFSSSASEHSPRAAIGNVAHVQENMSVARGKLPDAAMSARMAEYVEAL